ncbi:hypothetical protein GOBAR_AA15885 [Gossypium barbadense]|uniref:Uncharacterized protein n=1 Tax=Gossypium barbadense TaxID=3634 RepID=A0A2P5XN40_GOSBA|nr:hypothetical protein GOBAR_AA15885 [Gossypium barbadense]
MALDNSGPHTGMDLLQINNKVPLEHLDLLIAAGQTSPTINLGLLQMANGALLDCPDSKGVAGQILKNSNLGMEAVVGSSKKGPSIPISSSNIKASSLHSNPTFEKSPMAKVGLISNALDPKKHSVVTFQEKLDNKSKLKAHVNSPNISKGHNVENRKRIGLNRKSLFTSIHGRRENSNLQVIHKSPSLKLWAL